jgi:hypothetical protein
VTGLGTVAAVVLALLFAMAGVGKLVRPRVTAAAMGALSVPAARRAARIVPVGELVLAGVLLWRPALGGLMAIGVLGGFSWFVADRLRRGVTAACGCFGGASDRALSPSALVRNGLLAGLAGAALAAPRPVVPPLEAVLVVTTAMAVAAVVLTLVDLRQVTGRLWDNRLVTGPAGTQAPGGGRG